MKIRRVKRTVSPVQFVMANQVGALSSDLTINRLSGDVSFLNSNQFKIDQFESREVKQVDVFNQKEKDREWQVLLKLCTIYPILRQPEC